MLVLMWSHGPPEPRLVGGLRTRVNGGFAIPIGDVRCSSSLTLSEYIYAPLREPCGKLLAVLDETSRPSSSFLVASERDPLTQHVLPQKSSSRNRGGGLSHTNTDEGPQLAGVRAEFCIQSIYTYTELRHLCACNTITRPTPLFTS